MVEITALCSPIDKIDRGMSIKKVYHNATVEIITVYGHDVSAWIGNGSKWPQRANRLRTEFLMRLYQSSEVGSTQPTCTKTFTLHSWLYRCKHFTPIIKSVSDYRVQSWSYIQVPAPTYTALTSPFCERISSENKNKSSTNIYYIPSIFVHDVPVAVTVFYNEEKRRKRWK